MDFGGLKIEEQRKKRVHGRKNLRIPGILEGASLVVNQVRLMLSERRSWCCEEKGRERAEGERESEVLDFVVDEISVPSRFPDYFWLAATHNNNQDILCYQDWNAVSEWNSHICMAWLINFGEKVGYLCIRAALTACTFREDWLLRRLARWLKPWITQARPDGEAKGTGCVPTPVCHAPRSERLKLVEELWALGLSFIWHIKLDFFHSSFCFGFLHLIE